MQYLMPEPVIYRIHRVTNADPFPMLTLQKKMYPQAYCSPMGKNMQPNLSDCMIVAWHVDNNFSMPDKV